jgi:hypothetical protein
MDGSPPRRHEWAGTVDHPFDDDRPSGQQLVQSDAACSIAWLNDGFQAVQIFVDPVLTDRAEEICRTISGLCGQRQDLRSLTESVHAFAAGEGLSASVFERPPDALTPDLVAIAFTLG